MPQERIDGGCGLELEKRFRPHALFVLWEAGFSKAPVIFQELNEHFDVLHAEPFQIPDRSMSAFFRDFYGVERPDHYAHKMVEVGGNEAIAVLVASNGQSNSDFQEQVKHVKEGFRQRGPNILHASDSHLEVLRNFQAFAVDDVDVESLIGRPAVIVLPTVSPVGTVKLEFLTKAPPDSLRGLFQRLGEHVDYVLLRNWEDLPKGVEYLGAKDIDILVNDPVRAATVIMGKRVFSDPNRSHYFVAVADQVVAVDLRFPGDNYYDARWQSGMLANPIKANGLNVLPTEDYFWALVYHAFVHKGSLSDAYRDRLSCFDGDYGVMARDSPEKKLRTKLLKYLSGRGLRVTKPLDPSVHRFHVGSPTFARFELITRLFSSELARTIHREDFSFLPCFEDYAPGFRSRHVAGNIFRAGNFIVRRSSGAVTTFFLRNELKILNLLAEEPGFPRVVGLYRARGHSYLVTTAVAGRDLTALGPQPKRFPELLKRQLVTVTQNLRRRGIAHRDISPENLVWDGQQLHLVDFEFARLYSSEIETVTPFEEKFLHSVLPGVGRNWKESGVTIENWDEASTTLVLRSLQQHSFLGFWFWRPKSSLVRSRGKFRLSAVLRSRVQLEISSLRKTIWEWRK